MWSARTESILGFDSWAGFTHVFLLVGQSPITYLSRCYQLAKVLDPRLVCIANFEHAADFPRPRGNHSHRFGVSHSAAEWIPTVIDQREDNKFLLLTEFEIRLLLLVFSR